MLFSTDNSNSENSIVKSMDIMFTVLVFYTFIQWSLIGTLPGKLLFIFTCLVVVNDWLSFRATTEIYTGGMFLCDLTIVFIVANMVFPLSQPSPMGYSINYWLYFGGLLIIYVIWDFIVASLPQTSMERRKSLHVWMTVMFINAVLIFLTYAAQLLCIEHVFSNASLQVVVIWLPLLPVGMFSVTLFFWNRQKFTWLQRQFRKLEGKGS